MNRSLLNLVVDLLAASCLLVMLATGDILCIPLPPTINRTHALWGMSRHEWGTVHSWAVLVFLPCWSPTWCCIGFRVDQRDQFFVQGDPAPSIVPGHAESSRLIAIVSGKVKEMKAADDHLLPASEISILEAWINAGAPWPESSP